MTTTEFNPFEHAARTKKAIKLARTLVAAGVTEFSEINDTVKALAVQAAGVNEPSEATWAVVEVLITEGVS